jgi:hypothetical protein
MLYWINVIPHIRIVCGITIFALIVITFLTCMVYGISGDGYYSDAQRKAYEDKWFPRLLKALKWYVAIFVGALLGVIFVPDQRTVVLIAASEIGERVVNNPTVKDSVVDPSFELLKAFMKKETHDLLGSMKEPEKQD